MTVRIFSRQNFRMSLIVTYCISVICTTIGQNLVFLRGLSENSFVSLVIRAPHEHS
jgi:hypothetical protein